MKRYLTIVFAALAISTILTACSHDKDLYQPQEPVEKPQNQEQIKKEEQPEEQSQPQEQPQSQQPEEPNQSQELPNDNNQNQQQPEEQSHPQEQPNGNNQNQEQPDSSVQEEYNNAFEEAFGKPSEDQTWGF